MNRIPAIALSIALAVPALAGAAATEGQIRAIAAAAAEYNAARRSIAVEDWDGAIAALQRGAQLDSGSADIQNLLGFSYRKKRDLPNAFVHYNRALELNPRHIPTHEYIGHAWLMMGQPEKAKEHLALLEQYCPETCKERETLRQAIADWDPWKPMRSARAGY